MKAFIISRELDGEFKAVVLAETEEEALDKWSKSNVMDESTPESNYMADEQPLIGAGGLDAIKEFRDFLSREIRDYQAMLDNDKMGMLHNATHGHLEATANMARAAKEDEAKLMSFRKASRRLQVLLERSGAN